MVTDKYTIREMNEQRVLEQIIQSKLISRAHISLKTGLNKATVSEITKKLLEHALIEEVGSGESTNLGGRKPIMLQLNKLAGIAINIDAGYNYLATSLSYINGEMIEVTKNKNIHITCTNIFDEIDKIVTQYQSFADKTHYGFIGMTIAIHGIVDKNKILFTPYYDLDQIDLQKMLAEKYDFPIHLENEANLTAIAEQTFSAKQDSLISLSIHSGIGAGIILDNQLYVGNKGKAGEIGHTILIPHGYDCPCGNQGCLEQYCSEKAILDKFVNLSTSKTGTPDSLQQAFDKQDVLAKEIVSEFCFDIAIALNNLIASYAPEIIYLNSPIIRRIPETIPLIKSHLTNSFSQDIAIENSSLGSRASLYGGVALNIQHFLHVKKLYLDYVIA